MGGVRFEIVPYTGKVVPPENTYVGVLYQLGVVGFLLFVSVFRTVFVKATRNIAWAVFTLTVLISFAANDWLHFPVLWALLAIMMADLHRADADPTF
jgi:hypothetical protein